MWTPKAREMFLATVAVLGDKIPEDICDAVLIHGAPIRDDELDLQLLSVADDLQCCEKVRNIVLNGMMQADCRAKNLAYDGFEPWRDELVKLGMSEDDIIVMAPSPHTAAESANFLHLAQAKGWTDLVICSHPHHVLRCFLQIVAEMNKMKFWPDVYALSSGGIDWLRPCKKPVMAGGTGFTGDEEGQFHQFISGEFDRIETYAQEPSVDPATGKPKFTRNATIPEMFEYLAKRGQSK